VGVSVKRSEGEQDREMGSAVESQHIWDGVTLTVAGGRPGHGKPGVLCIGVAPHAVGEAPIESACHNEECEIKVHFERDCG